MLEVAVLGSGSQGNALLIRAGATVVLVDAGLSAKQLCLRMAGLGVAPDSLAGILLTHEHGDHTRGLRVLCGKRDLPVFCNRETREALVEARSDWQALDWRLFESGNAFVLGGLEVRSFLIPHDAAEPLGFCLRKGEARFGVLSDVGHVTHLAREGLRGAQGLFLEANYDEQLLEEDLKRPWSTKQRIASRHGHLSNEQATELVAELAETGLETVVFGHLSRDCNQAERLLRRARERCGEKEPQMHVAEQERALGWLRIGKPPVRRAFQADLFDRAVA
ncbi:MAG: MBL fold metallo-hydrolase [Verrucomicrobiota bacterium]